MKNENINYSSVKSVKDVTLFLSKTGILDEEKYTKLKNRYVLANLFVFLMVIVSSAYLNSQWNSYLFSISILVVLTIFIYFQTKDIRFKVRSMSLSDPKPAKILSIDNRLGFRGMREVHTTYSYEIRGTEYGPFKKSFMYPHGFDESDFRGVNVICDPLNHAKHGAFALDHNYNWNEFNLRKEQVNG